jgi:alkylation response protein AidB-like acyl-CoA dehydrogenase
MDLSYNAEYDQYRVEVVAFLVKNWNLALARDKTYVASFRKIATQAGYLYRNFPKQYGGAGVAPDVLQAQIIREEFAKVRAPKELGGNGTMMLAPTLVEHGTDQQKEKFIAKTLSGEYRWAQGYSEPGAGSDLASLKTKAELVGGEWVINGQKIWTTDAQSSNYMFALVRTESDVASKHAGISYLLIDMKQPGVTVRPLKPMYGGHAFCEVFLEDVRTPADWIVGERGEGWAVSKSTLKHERNSVGAATGALDTFNKLVKVAKTEMLDGKPAIESPLIREQLGVLEGYVRAHLYSGYYQLTKDAQGKSAGIISMMNKINSSNIGHKIAEISTAVLEDKSLMSPVFSRDRKPGNERWVNQILGSLAATIGGGTSNIQLNIIAERGLELPREESKN